MQPLTNSNPAPILHLSNISKTYPGGTQALVDINLDVRAGEIVCLLGPSGCGKTTLLRVVAGLETPDHGAVTFNGRDLVAVPPHRRGFGFMFQDFALFPHRTVAENVEFGLRMASMPREERTARVAAMLKLVNLPDYGARTIFELSGGERQRVALARSLAPQPALIMLDEPLGSLDRGLREELVEELHTILKQLGVTALYVTHDQDEALALGDRIVVMRRGQIEQIGSPHALYTTPATPFVARFLGHTNLLAAQTVSGGITTALGFFPCQAPPDTDAVTLLIRPEAARLVPQQSIKSDGFQNWRDNPHTVLLQGHLHAATYHGDNFRIEVKVHTDTSEVNGSHTLRFILPTHQRMHQDAPLEPLQLPPLQAPIALLISTDLATLLPYALNTNAADAPRTPG